MRHVWGFASTIGLCVFVVFGTWGCLTSSADDPTASRSMLIALGGLVLTIVALIARGDGPATLAKVRQALGALGLVLTPIFAVLAVLAIASDATTVLQFLVLFLLAMAAWAQAIAAQPGLSFRVALVWLVALVVGVAVAVVAGGLILAVFTSMGLGSSEASDWVRAIGLAAIGLLGAAWVRGRPDRRAVPQALGRAALGRATPSDVELLASGPGPILRRRPGIDPRQDRVDAALAATDLRLAGAAEPSTQVERDDPTTEADG
jgi:hypothetical protein